MRKNNVKRQIKQGIKGIASGSSNVVARALNKPMKPRWLVLMTTDKCNSRCKHCNIWQETPTKDPMTPAEINKVLSSPLFRNIEFILNTGGEATVRGDLEELFMAEHKALPKAQLQLSTNGLLPERVLSLVNYVINKDIPIDVGTSLDGVGDKHDFVRGVNGNFDKVERLLKELTAIKQKHPGMLNVSVGFVLSSLSLPMLPDVRNYLKKEFEIEPFVQWYNESTFYDNLNSKLVKNEELLNTVKSIPEDMLGGPNLKKLWLNWLTGKSVRISCFAMHTFCVMKCNGDIAPCLSKWDVKAGNVRETDPEEVWASAEAIKSRQIVKKCEGCLNSWGANWSWSSSYYPFVFHYLRNPHKLIKAVI
jgi:MoaA/NifB/PqqE/SkfB family radical SAM enzyme